MSNDRKDQGPARTRGSEAALTIIAVGTRFVGDVQSDGVVKIEGEVSGSVRADRQVLLARGGVVEGDLITGEALLGGEVRGAVIANARVEVQAGAVVHGDITTERLVVQEGGEVNGVVRMGTEAPQHGAGSAREKSTPVTVGARG